MSEPVGRPQGGFKSEAGKAAYWRLQHESAIGALADLIAEHTETVETHQRAMADLRAQVMALASPDPEYNNAIGDVLALLDALSIIDGGDE
jgi:hypothetical protein